MFKTLVFISLLAVSTASFSAKDVPFGVFSYFTMEYPTATSFRIMGEDMQVVADWLVENKMLQICYIKGSDDQTFYRIHYQENNSEVMRYIDIPFYEHTA